jgi:hypothetical protein
MCNLCSITTKQQAIRALFRVVSRCAGKLLPMPRVMSQSPLLETSDKSQII